MDEDDRDDENASLAKKAEEITRDLRKDLFISESLDVALGEVQSASTAEDADRALRAVLCRWLGTAWLDGAGREADLRSAVAILQSQIKSLKKSNRALLRRISDSRNEP